MASTTLGRSDRSMPFGTLRPGLLRRLGLQTLYLLTGLPLALAAFIGVVVGVSLGFGLLITIVGFAVLTVALLVARLFATVERARLVVWMGVEPAPIVYRPTAATDGWIARLTSPLRDAQSWRDVAHAIIILPIALVTWTMTIVWLAVAAAGLSFPLWGWLDPDGTDNEDLPEIIGLGSGYGIRVVFWVIVGSLAAASLPWVVAAVAWVQATVGDLLLLSPARRTRQIDDLVERRDATRAAEQSSFRRLERDIHDGPQQRLVRLSMDLGRAQRKAREVAPELSDALDDARRQTHEALDELRALSRGIAPPILADRGLERALQELAVRSAIPTECSVDLGEAELSDHVESALYFVASEAVANAAKHSGASRTHIRISVEGAAVTLVVSDDGAGGAAMIPGHGLAGLDERARAVGGVLTVTSPIGGPTVIVAEMPCGS